MATKRSAEQAAVKVSRHAADAEPFFDKCRFAWGDGCFFTMLVSTVRGPIEDKESKTGWKWDETQSEEPVTPNAPECWLWIRLANRIDFDPDYSNQFGTQEDIGGFEARLGKWSIAFNLRGISDGVAGAFFVDEWWKEITSTSCQGRSRIVVRYILATRHLLSAHALSKDITRAPAAQSAVCDPLKYDASQAVPNFGAAIDVSKIKDLRSIYQAILNEGFKDDVFVNRDGSNNVVIGVMSRVQARDYTPKIDRMRKAALAELFNAGAWRIRYFEKLGGEFKNLGAPKATARVVPPRAADTVEALMQQLLTGLFQPVLAGFATSVKEACDAAAKAAYLEYEEWLLKGLFTDEEIAKYKLDKNARRNGSDAHFRIWFCEAYYLEEPREENDETIASLHPLHLTPFDLDVCKSAAIVAEMYKTELWNTNVHVTRVVGGSVAPK